MQRLRSFLCRTYSMPAGLGDREVLEFISRFDRPEDYEAAAMMSDSPEVSRVIMRLSRDAAERKRVALAAMLPAKPDILSLSAVLDSKHAKVVTLRTGEPFAGISIDREAGALRNVSIITAGPALGHGFVVDAKMLQQTAAGLRGRVPMHLSHAHAQGGLFSAPADGITSLVGHVIPGTARVDGASVRADVQLLAAAANSPSGNLRQYLLDLAAEAPDAFGLSIVFEAAEFEEIDGTRHGRVHRVLAVDFVGEPGANPNGLLSQGKDMTTDKTTTTTPADTAAAEMQALQAAEASLRSLAKFSKMDEATAEAFVAKCLAEGTTFEVAKKLALEHMRGVFSNPAIRSQATITSTGNHSLDSLAIGIEDAIMLRAGATRLLRTDNQGNVMLGDDGKPSYRAPHERAAQFRHLPVVEMLRLQLRLLGADVDYLSRPQVAELLSRHQLRRKHPEVFALAQSTSDFGSILENVMGKTLRQMYLEAPRTWDRWARRTTAPDFRAVKRTQLSTSADLVPGGEGSGIQYGILTDSGESYSLSEYKGGIRLTRQAIINDDLDAFGRIPRLQAAAAARLEEDLAIGILTDNDDLADGDPLFDDTARSNVGTAAPFGIDSVAAGYAAIRQQRSLGGSLLDLRPNVLLTSVQLAAAASGFKASVSPTEFANVVPPFLASLEVLDSPRLGADDWFLIAQDYGSIEVCFLESEPMPVLRSETDFDTEDQKFAVRHTVAAKAIDWRGLYQGEHTDEDEG